MEFHCRLGTAAGEIVEGVYGAKDEAHLRREFEGKGLLVLSMERRGRLSWSVKSFRRRQRLGQRDFIVFNQELAALLRAGLPLVESLKILKQRVENPIFKATLEDVYERVRGGEALSEAFEAQSLSFSGVYTASLMAGEKSGSLEEVVRRYVSHAQVLSAIRRKTTSAMVYPAVLLVLSLVVVGIIVLQVVPEFADFYDGLGAELPVITLVIVSASEVIRNHLLMILVVITIFALGLRTWLRQPGRETLLDQLFLRVPGIGQIIGKFGTSQFSRTLATLLGGGIPLAGALEVTGRSIGNRYIGYQLETICREVREGQPLSVSMSARGVFPPVAIKMVEVGESTGALQDMLNSVADFLDEEIETTLGRFMTLLEPVLLVIMGLIIAVMLLALYMPLLQLGTIVQ